jgi:DNA replication protein DnaC
MDTTTEIEREPATCRTCVQPFQAAFCRHPLNPSAILARQLHCDACVDAEKLRVAVAERSRREEEQERETREAWDAICPSEFRTRFEGGATDVERLEREQPALREIMRHPHGSRGLILRGTTGAAKTRCMYRLLRSRFILTPRPSIIAMTSGRFDREARDAAGNFTLTQWFKRMAKADLLFIDDLGKGKWGPGTAGQLWEIVDDRCANGLPIFITTNFPGDKLAGVLGLDGDTAAPLLRRLREHCNVIVMKPAMKKEGEGE